MIFAYQIREIFDSLIEIDERTGCWNWKPKSKTFTVPEDGLLYAPHYVWEEIAEREIPKGMCLVHTCGNTNCMNPDHMTLSFKTAAKLCPEFVQAIRMDNRSISLIATEYGVCDQTIAAVKQRRIWNDVPDGELPPHMKTWHAKSPKKKIVLIDREYNLTNKDIVKIFRVDKSITELSIRYNTPPDVIKRIRNGALYGNITKV